jgi:hypothetical protein
LIKYSKISKVLFKNRENKFPITITITITIKITINE